MIGFNPKSVWNVSGWETSKVLMETHSEQLTQLVAMLDGDGDGLVTKQDFVRLMATMLATSTPHLHDGMVCTFRFDGFSELTHFLRPLGSREQVDG